MPTKNKSFSIVRALNAHIDNDWTRAEYEKEVITEIRTDNTKGISIPASAFRAAGDKQPMQKMSATDGKELVDDQLLVGEFIDVLYNNSWLSTVGVRRMSGLVGDITIQKKSGKPNFGWLAESANITLSNFQVGTLKMNPKTMGGGVATSRKLMMQSTPSVEALIRNAIIEGAAEAVEEALLNATGADDSPKGIMSRVQGAHRTDMAGKALTRKTLIDAVTAIRSANVRGSLYAMMNARQAGYLMNTNVSGATFPQFILSNGSMDAGESIPVVVTEHMKDGEILIGDFSQMIVGAWGNVDLVPDTSTLAASGGLVVRLWQDMDIQCRYEEAFHLLIGISPPKA